MRWECKLHFLNVLLQLDQPEHASRELKTVTNWFQNKRQTSKKKSLVWSGDFRPQSTRLASSIPHSARLLRPTISLDQIAGLHEKFTVSTINSDKPPLTPRNSNRRAFKSSSNHKNALWDHMPSSPIAPPSSPSADSARLSILPQRSKTKKSLEWACAKARAEGRGDDEGALPDIPEVQRDEDRCEEMGSDQETDTDSELDEAITPDGSANFSPGFSISLDCKGDLKTSLGKENIDPNFFPRRHESEDMEAAIVLLGFMGPR